MESSAAASMSLPAARVQKTQAIIPHRTFEGHTGWVTNVIHLRGGQRIMTCSDDDSMRVWDVERGKQIGEDWRHDSEGGGINTIALSPNGKKVLSGSVDGAVRLWDIDTGKVIAKWTGHTIGVASLCWNGDGQRVLSGSNDGTVRVWDAETGKTILRPLKLTQLTLEAAVYSPDETMIAAGGGYGDSEDNDIGFIKICNANTGKLVKNLEFTESVHCLAWPGDGKTLIFGSNDGKIRIWNTITWQQSAVLTGHTAPVYGIAISPNGRVLASASCDNTARLWNLDNDQPISLPLQHADDLHCLSFSADGKVLATGCGDRNAYTWDVSAIVREAGLDELLFHSHDIGKLLPDIDAPGRPVQPLRNAPRLPPAFFDNSLGHPASSGRRRPSLSAHQDQAVRGLASRGRTILSSLFRRIAHNSHEAIHGHPPNQLRGVSSGAPLRQTHEAVALQERRSTVVDVPFAQGQRRNASAREIRSKREKEKNAKKASAQPLQSSVTQQSGAAPQTQPSSKSNVAVSTLSSTPAVAATSAGATSLPDITIPQAGHWTRFWLRLCCPSAQYADGHH